jgi:hypothetical protein
MTRPTSRRTLQVASLALSLGTVLGTAGLAQPPKGAEYYTGKVRPLAEAPPKAAGSGPWFALFTDDGKKLPIHEEPGSRTFSKDKRLHDRPMRLTARTHPETGMLQIIDIHSYKNGKLHEVYYWCDICSIRRFELQNCDCCNEIMELRETPVK